MNINCADIRKELDQYIFEIILPQYANMDLGHNETHIQYVMNKSIKIAKKYNIDMEMIYVAAAFHDLGLRNGREGHSEKSADIMSKDNYICQLFDLNQIEIMKEAIEDHSSSLKREPRSIYGKILYQADRNLDINVIVYRAMAYTTKNFPDLSFQGQFERVQKYLKGKYAEGGSLKLWLDYEKDKDSLKLVRIQLKDKDFIKQICGNFKNRK